MLSTSGMPSSSGRRLAAMDLRHEDSEGGHGTWTGREKGACVTWSRSEAGNEKGRGGGSPPAMVACL
jgi:hypothetical protein